MYVFAQVIVKLIKFKKIFNTIILSTELIKTKPFLFTSN